MPSSYTTRLRIEKPQTGEQDGLWGNTANTVFDLIDVGISGYVSVAMSDANYTLTALNGADDEARNAVIALTGSLTATRNVVCPTAEKHYLVHNNTSGSQSIVFKTSSGTGITIPNGRKRWVYCDGTNVVDSITDLPSGTTINGVAISSATTTETLQNKTLDNSNIFTIRDDRLTLQDNSDTSKQVVFQLSGITTATTRTLTIPDATDTLVALAATQTLSNKTLGNSNIITVRDDRLTLQDNSDATKQAVFELSGITTATTRTITLPDLSGTMVLTTGAQTITGKTITVADNALTIQDNGDATKQAQFELSGITTGTTRTITVPDASFTMVGLATAQSPTNKTYDNSNTFTIRDDRLTLQDNADTTKQLTFQLSGITTGTTRTLTVPDATGTLLLTTGSGSSLTGVKLQGKETIWVPAVAMYGNTTSGAVAHSFETATNDIMVNGLEFPDGATTTKAQFTIQMPKSWDEGTITWQAVWTANSTSTNSVVWQLRAVAISDNQAIDTAYGTATTVTDANGSTAYTARIAAESSATTIGSTPAEGDWVVFEILRDPTNGSDTLAATAVLIGVRIFYTTNAGNDA